MVRRNDRTGRRQAWTGGRKQDRAERAAARPERRTGADGVSVLPAAMVAALVAAGVAINRSVRKARSTPPRKAVVPGARGAAGAGGGGGGGGAGGAGAAGAEDVAVTGLRSIPQERASGPAILSGQVAVRPTVDDDGR
ncbi:hypothetical protein [Citricoccus sp. SGAir0253]|uniref:hypothetical protein n=1 Tax=Citricoccus sp. SGAir0253 TaxID=2567881 RepID=UPI00143CDD17|nr:hypothetical protein [Citricoccus sp. SGAir0253]